MVEAVARAAGVPGAVVRRAMMLRGRPRPGGRGRWPRAGRPRGFHLQVGRPLLPMLADAPTSRRRMARVGPAALEWKLDGARVQSTATATRWRVHPHLGRHHAARARGGRDRTGAAGPRRPCSTARLIALQPDGRPHPFQVTVGPVGAGSTWNGSGWRCRSRCTSSTLHVDGEDLIDRAGLERLAALARWRPRALRVPRMVTGDPEAAAGFLADALAHGHEGVMVKALTAPTRPAGGAPAG